MRGLDPHRKRKK